MDPNEIRKQQKDSWNKFSSGWKKWDDLTMKFLAPAGEAILKAASLKDDSKILDVASGTGEPGLTAAGIAKKGKVTAVDLSDGMIAIANENAKARGLTNFESKVGSAEKVDAPDSSFDAVLCRFGYMFFPDVPAAAKEMARVLKPGGRIAASVWSMPELNPWATTVMGIIANHVEIPPPPPEAPGLFRCAKADLLASQFRAAGLKDVKEREIKWEATYQTPEVYWTMMTEMAPPVVAGLAKTDAATREKIHQEVLSTVAGNVRKGELFLACAARIVEGTK